MIELLGGEVEQRSRIKKILFWTIVAAVSIFVLFLGVRWMRNRKNTEDNGERFNLEVPDMNVANELTVAREYEDAETMYKRLIRENGDPEAYYHLGELYYQRARGDRDPIIGTALDMYKKAVSEGYMDALIKVADIYNYCTLQNVGAPNKKLSRSIYKSVTESRWVNSNVKREAHLKMTELNREEQMEMARRGGMRRQEPPTQAILREYRIPDRPRDGIRPRRIRNATRGRRNDSQNVHDNGIQKDFANAITRLKRMNRFNRTNVSAHEIVPQVRNMVLEITGVDENERRRALNSIDDIGRVNSTISSAGGMTECEILGLVWNRILSPDNGARRDDLERSLFDQLADATVDGKTVCATGRTTRVMQSLEKMDADENLVKLRPKWAMKEELAGMAGQVRGAVLSKFKRTEVEAYENDDKSSKENELSVRRVTAAIKDAIMRKGTNDYVTTGLMTAQELKENLKPILDAV